MPHFPCGIFVFKKVNSAIAGSSGSGSFYIAGSFPRDPAWTNPTGALHAFGR